MFVDASSVLVFLQTALLTPLAAYGLWCLLKNNRATQPSENGPNTDRTDERGVDEPDFLASHHENKNVQVGTEIVPEKGQKLGENAPNVSNKGRLKTMVEGVEVIVTLVNSWASNNIASIELYLRKQLKQQAPQLKLKSLEVEHVLEVKEFSLKEMTSQSSTIRLQFVGTIKSTKFKVGIIKTRLNDISVSGGVFISVAYVPAWPHIGKVELTLDQSPVVQFELSKSIGRIPFSRTLIQSQVDKAINTWAKNSKVFTLYEPKTKGTTTNYGQGLHSDSLTRGAEWYDDGESGKGTTTSGLGLFSDSPTFDAESDDEVELMKGTSTSGLGLFSDSPTFDAERDDQVELMKDETLVRRSMVIKNSIDTSGLLEDDDLFQQKYLSTKDNPIYNYDEDICESGPQVSATSHLVQDLASIFGNTDVDLAEEEDWSDDSEDSTNIDQLQKRLFSTHV